MREGMSTDEELEVDSKLWPGAAAAGWTLKALQQGHYKYFAPDGRVAAHRP